MKFDRYFWKSGRNRRTRNAEEWKNIKHIALIFAGMALVGLAAGSLLIWLLT